MDDEPEIKNKKIIYNKHDGHSFIDRMANVKQLVERFHWFGESEKLPYELNCTHLIHFTENEFATNIGFDNLNYFCFKTYNCNLFKEENAHHFVWWAALVPDGWDNEINRENPEHKVFFEKWFCKSPAFNGDSLCGPIGFVVPWKDILEQYAISRGKKASQIQLKTFCSVLYRREIMYAILVCTEGDVITYKDEDGTEKEFTLIEDETEAYRSTNNGDESFIWKLYSTSYWSPSGHKDCPRGTWDHLSFAFYYPNKNNTMNISPQLCSIKTKTASSFRPYSRTYWGSRESKEMKPDSEIVNKLLDKINQKVNY